MQINQTNSFCGVPEHLRESLSTVVDYTEQTTLVIYLPNVAAVVAIPQPSLCCTYSPDLHLGKQVQVVFGWDNPSLLPRFLTASSSYIPLCAKLN